MKRLLLVAACALTATAVTPALSHAGGAFGLFYCPKYCSSYCQACCPVNAFSSNGCLVGCCPPPMWPQTGYGCGGCGSFMPCYGPTHYEHNPGCKGCGKHGCGKQGGCGSKGCAPGGGCGVPGGGSCGPCCRMGTPHALNLVQSSPQSFGPVCCHAGCGMESYGNGGLRHHAPCKGGSCASEHGGNGFHNGNMAGPMLYSWAAPEAPAVPTANQNGLAQYWTANMAQQAANYHQQVSYQGYYFPASPMAPAWGYGYGYYPPMHGYQAGW
jgi:hypothetical protein